MLVRKKKFLIFVFLVLISGNTGNATTSRFLHADMQRNAILGMPRFEQTYNLDVGLCSYYFQDRIWILGQRFLDQENLGNLLKS